MARTTAAAVQGILGPQYDGSSALTPFIEAANNLTSRVDTLDTDNVLSAANLEMIERWLAAHFYAHADQLRQSEGVGRANSSYQGQTGMFLTSTQYGQTAIAMDFTGALSRINSQSQSGRPKVTFDWMGLPPSEQTDYIDRD